MTNSGMDLAPYSVGLLLLIFVSFVIHYIGNVKKRNK
jgi:hypothetical protein